MLVRTIEDDKYEVIAGARRLRAAKLAALEEVPVRVVELSDAACVETQLVENIQRENVHPLEEAFAFHGLYNRVGNSCLIFEAQENESLGRPWPLPRDHASCDAGLPSVSELCQIVSVRANTRLTD